MDDPSSNLLLFFAELSAESVAAGSWLYISFKIFSVFLLVAANGFFVGAEFALVAVRKSRIEILVNEGSRNAKRLLDILNNLNPYLSAFQLGITLASLGLGWVGEPVIAALLEGWLIQLPESARHIVSFIIAFTLITSLHIVLGEQAPKLIGLAVAEKVALAVALPMQIFYKVFKPFIFALDWASAKVVNLFGLQATSEHASIYTEDELRQLIEISHKSGHVNREEKQLIDRVFEFSETTVREAMIPRTQMAAISQNSTLQEIAQAFNEHGFSRLPVYRESLDDVIGFVHSKDVLPFLLKPKSFNLEAVLQSPLYVVDTAKLEDVLRQMQKAKIHFGFVVDEHGGVEGIITLEDLLEEIVGDISDEHDEEVNEQIRENADGSYLLDGGLAVRDLNRRLNLHIPETEGFTTIAGFLMSEAGQVLQEGEIVRFNGHLFKVEKVDRRRILQVRMEKVEDSQDENIVNNIAV
jgi:CBS domain containing-hemolysin-like protein